MSPDFPQSACPNIRLPQELVSDNGPQFTALWSIAGTRILEPLPTTLLPMEQLRDLCMQLVKQAMRKVDTALPLKERLTLIFPNLAPTVEHHQQRQKTVHNGKESACNVCRGGEGTGKKPEGAN